MKDWKAIAENATELIQYFVDRVENGTIRSKTTYKKYKDFLQSIESQEVEGVSAEEWIRFEDKLPLEGQEIMITWPSGNYHPEYRKVTNEMLKGDYSQLRWIPIPNY